MSHGGSVFRGGGWAEFEGLRRGIWRFVSIAGNRPDGHLPEILTTPRLGEDLGDGWELAFFVALVFDVFTRSALTGG
jgi:hypothetical protein